MGERTTRRSDPVLFAEIGYAAITVDQAWTGTRTAPGLTMVLVECGELELELGGTTWTVAPMERALFWSGLPNRVVFAEGTIVHGLHAPIVEVLSWSSSNTVLTRALSGALLRIPLTADVARAECAAYVRWAEQLHGPDRGLRHPSRLEIEASFRRAIAELAADDLVPPPAMPANVAGVAAAMTFAAEHFSEPITVNDIAAAVGWQRDHLMETFRRTCGITVWEYVLRIRVAEARRLLRTTDDPIADVCGRAGFGSISRMYEAFQQFSGTTPADHRRGSLRS